MEIKAFRIEGFRSIRKTGWLPFSVDGITALVGQNESGKSSILDALALGFSWQPVINRNDFRGDCDLPLIAISIEMSPSDIDEITAGYDDDVALVLRGHIALVGDIELIARVVESEAGVLSRKFQLGNTLDRIFSEEIEAAASSNTMLASSGEPISENGVGTPSIRHAARTTSENLVKNIWHLIPSFVLFDEGSSYLPDSIEVLDGKLVRGAGWTGATNFFAAAGLELTDLLTAGDRAQATLVRKASVQITKELQKFWSQVLGKKGKITIELEIKHHSSSKGEKSGMPYILFWVSEGDGERLHPSQRSKGTRWFLSFFLQMVASQREGYNFAFLLDEPGAFLHAKAQADVLQLLERLSDLRPIVYSTHSPYLLDEKCLHRILAVERIDDEEGSETIVRRGLELAASSKFTLAPILGAMGLRLSDQEVIKQSGNVLLEESSAFYYYSSFCHLLKRGSGLSFVACGGVDAVSVMADLMIAWGLEYMVLVDDDKQGKVVCRGIKNKYGLSDEEAKLRLCLTDGFSSVEDLFEPSLFRSVVAGSYGLDGSKTNSESIRERGISKPMLAANFYNRVREGKIALTDLDDSTIARFDEQISKAESAFRKVLGS